MSSSAFTRALLTSDVFTANGALSVVSNDALPKFFFKMTRDLNSRPEDAKQLFADAFNTDRLSAMILLFHLRDIREGKGERGLFRICAQWLIDNGYRYLLTKNAANILEFGRGDDLLFCQQYEFIAQQIYRDLMALRTNPNANISLLAKWLPTEKKHLWVENSNALLHFLGKALMQDYQFDRRKDFDRRGHLTKKAYRQKIRNVLCSRLDITERHLSDKEYAAIKYEAVPSRAMQKYSKLKTATLGRPGTFLRNDTERFTAYRESLKRDSSRVNFKCVSVHEMVHACNTRNYNEVTEAQYKQLRADIKKSGVLSDCICVCDVSGSMGSKLHKSTISCMDVSVGLSILVSDCIGAPFKNHVITFSARPTFFVLDENDTLDRKVTHLQSAEWGCNTDLQAVFDLILRKATQHALRDSELPKRLFIFSDMQFDMACSRNNQTNYQAIAEKYRQHNYTMPHVIFWNIAAYDTKELPVNARDEYTTLLSGFSPNLLKQILSCRQLSTMGLISDILSSDRYKSVVI